MDDCTKDEVGESQFVDPKIIEIKFRDFEVITAFDDLAVPPEILDLTESMELKVQGWRHYWYCNAVNYCETDFFGTGFVINKNNGLIYTWNLIETTAFNDCNISPDNMSNYKKFTNAQYGDFGWGRGREGRSVHVSARLKFYADWGWISWVVNTEKCP